MASDTQAQGDLVKWADWLQHAPTVERYGTVFLQESERRAIVECLRAAALRSPGTQEGEPDRNKSCRTHEASAVCATCGKHWGAHFGEACDEDGPRRFTLRAQEGEPIDVLAALKGMQRFWGKYPEFVYAPEYREQAYAAVDAMNAALAQAQKERNE